MIYRRVEKESDELLYTVWSLVMVRKRDDFSFVSGCNFGQIRKLTTYVSRIRNSLTLKHFCGYVYICFIIIYVYIYNFYIFLYTYVVFYVYTGPELNLLRWNDVPRTSRIFCPKIAIFS